MRKAAYIHKYLSQEVADGKHRFAKDSRRHLSKIVKEAGGSLTRFEVINGDIFFELKDQSGLKELQDALSPLSGVTFEEISPVKLVFLKAQALAERKAA
jgi:hypothetical protein